MALLFRPCFEFSLRCRPGPSLGRNEVLTDVTAGVADEYPRDFSRGTPRLREALENALEAFPSVLTIMRSWKMISRRVSDWALSSSAAAALSSEFAAAFCVVFSICVMA